MAIYVLSKWRPVAILISTEVKFEVISVKSVCLWAKLDEHVQ